MRNSAEGNKKNSAEVTKAINWLGEDYLVKVVWTVDAGELVSVKCSVGGKEVVKYFRGVWTDKKNRRYDDSHFIKLKRYCMENFRHERHLAQAFMPIFSILHGEEM